MREETTAARKESQAGPPEPHNGGNQPTQTTLTVNGKSFGRLAFDTLAPSLTLGALIVYAMLFQSYARFYGPLGVNLEDVGITYIAVLTQSSGFVLITLVVLATALTILILLFPLVQSLLERCNWLSHEFKLWTRVIFFATAIIIVAWLNPLPDRAKQAADLVRAGNAVLPFHGWLDQITLPIHAYPAELRSVGKKGDSPFIESLEAAKLFYLGEAKGVTVLYDSSQQQAVYVPTSSVILRTHNCNSDNPHHLCGG